MAHFFVKEKITLVKKMLSPIVPELFNHALGNDYRWFIN